MRKAITGGEFMNNLRDRTQQEISIYDSNRNITDFSKIISTEADLLKPYTKDSFLSDAWASHLNHLLPPFRHTWVYCCCLHSPYIPRILHFLQKGDQVWLRDYETCSSEKRIFVLLEFHQFPTQYVFMCEENAWLTVNTA